MKRVVTAAREQSLREYDAWKATLKPLPPRSTSTAAKPVTATARRRQSRCVYCGRRTPYPATLTCRKHRDLPAIDAGFPALLERMFADHPGLQTDTREAKVAA